MNVALLITEGNREGISAFVDSFSKHQDEKVNGVLAVYFDWRIPEQDIRDIIAPITSLFPVTVIRKGTTNGSFPDEWKRTSMFSLLTRDMYTKAPGPWLIVDDWAIVNVTNPINLVEREHAIGGKLCSGRAMISEGSVIPVGPVVMGLSYSDMLPLFRMVNSNWRERIRYILARGTFCNVDHDKYAFCLSRNHTPEVKDDEPAAVPDAEIIDPSALSDEDLDTAYWNVIGSRPHHKTTRAGKIMRINQMQNNE